MSAKRPVAALVAQLALLGIAWEVSVFFFKQTPTFIEMVILIYLMSINYFVKGGDK